MRYLDTLPTAPDGALNDLLAVRAGRIVMAGRLDLLALAEQHGTPLEIACCPQITRRIHALQDAFSAAAAATGYRGAFHYAYATKANVAAEVTRTALESGAHYETSSAADVRIARMLRRAGLIPPERLIFCNGSKDQRYIAEILALRAEGHANLVPILDDAAEFAALRASPEPLLLGVRARAADHGRDRFGMLPDELAALAGLVRATPHRIICYHAMLGSQIEESGRLAAGVARQLADFAALRPLAPDLRMYSFGGGWPTGAYALTYQPDHPALMAELLTAVAARAAELRIPHPDLVGEFGRYTVADHGAIIVRVGRYKLGAPRWALVDASLMVSLPDMLIVRGQTFITLALNHLDDEAVPTLLGGRHTCDSDDVYPREGDMLLPLAADGPPLLVAFFGTGAYQAMLSGEGGAHHCLTPEARKLIITAAPDGSWQHRLVAEQSWDDILGELGYTRDGMMG